MKIYTSYFAKINKLPQNVVPIAICAKVPPSCNILQYKKLSPKYGFFMEWKKNGDNDFYIEHFQKEVLDVTDANDVIDELQTLIRHFADFGELDICLVCYEKPTDFCHRHLVSKWLRESGYDCEEYIY